LIFFPEKKNAILSAFLSFQSLYILYNILTNFII